MTKKKIHIKRNRDKLREKEKDKIKGTKNRSTEKVA